MNAVRIKRLAKKYFEINKYNNYIEEALLGKSYYLDILKSKGIDTSKRNLTKLKKYISIYKAVFIKTCQRLDSFDSYIAKEVYMKGKKVCRVSMDNYLSEAGVYRILKKFDLYFYYDLLKCARIINPLMCLLNC